MKKVIIRLLWLSMVVLPLASSQKNYNKIDYSKMSLRELENMKVKISNQQCALAEECKKREVIKRADEAQVKAQREETIKKSAQWSEIELLRQSLSDVANFNRLAEDVKPNFHDDSDPLPCCFAGNFIEVSQIKRDAINVLALQLNKEKIKTSRIEDLKNCCTEIGCGVVYCFCYPTEGYSGPDWCGYYHQRRQLDITLNTYTAEAQLKLKQLEDEACAKVPEDVGIQSEMMKR